MKFLKDEEFAGKKSKTEVFEYVGGLEIGETTIKMKDNYEILENMDQIVEAYAGQE